MNDSNLHILFVDDNPGDRDLAQEAFGETGLNVLLHTVCDGDEALAFLRREGQFKDAPRPVVVLLDLNMPKKDGLMTLKEIKADNDLRSIPVVIFSSSTAPNDLYMAYQQHANAYVIKPLELDGFLRVIQQVKMFWCTVATNVPQDKVPQDKELS